MCTIANSVYAVFFLQTHPIFCLFRSCWFIVQNYMWGAMEFVMVLNLLLQTWVKFLWKLYRYILRCSRVYENKVWRRMIKVQMPMNLHNWMCSEFVMCGTFWCLGFLIAKKFILNSFDCQLEKMYTKFVQIFLHSKLWYLKGLKCQVDVKIMKFLWNWENVR